MPIQLPQHAAAAVQQLRRQQIPCWVTGSALRSSLLGCPAAEWELTAVCTPAQAAAALPGAAPAPDEADVLQQPGLRVVLCGADGSRTPEAALRGRLARQLLTVDAMAWDGQVVLDPHHGRYDLADRLLRCTGEPEAQFAHRPLQSLRLYRLAAELDFAIEPCTAAAALRAAAEPGRLTAPQVRAQLEAALMGARPSALWPLVACGALRPFGLWYAGLPAPEQNPLLPLDAVPAVPVLRWWALAKLCGCGLYRLQTALAQSERFARATNRLQAFYREGMPADRHALRRRLMEPLPGGDEAALLTFAAVDAAFDALPGLYAAVAARREPYRVEHLRITPAELLAEGVPAGKLAAVQRCLLQAVVDTPELNVWPVLAQMAKSLRRLV